MTSENKLLSILRTFRRKDLRLFGKFISSPYFNRHAQVLEFYRYVVRFHPDFSESSLTKEKLFEKFFKNKKYDDKKIRYLFTDLTRLLEKYLVNEQLRVNRQAFHHHLLEAHRNRDNLSEFRRLYHERIKSTGKNIKNASTHYYLFADSELYLNYIRPMQSRKEESNIVQVMQELDLFYANKKLELSCETENTKALLDKNYQPFLLDELMNGLHNHPWAKHAYLAAYMDVLRILKNPDDENSFDVLMKRLKTDEADFEKHHLRELYQYLLNFCIKKINTGRNDYLQNIFQIYKVILGNGVLLTTGLLSQWDYKNIVTVSLRLKNYSWAKTFIQENKKHLAEQERDNAFNYNMANLHFQKKEYTAALKLLQSVEFTDPVYQLDSRAMLLKIYFEQDDPDALYYHFKAFQTFIARNKLVSGFHKTLYGNLIRFTKKLAQAQGDNKALVALQKQLDSETQVADLLWLKSQLGAG